MDKICFEELYNLHWKELYNYCLYQCRESGAAEEIVQDVFLSLWERLDTFEMEGELKRYLYGAVKNKICDYYRAKAKEENLISELRLNVCDEGCFTEEAVYFSDLHRNLHQAIESLPCRCRDVYRLSRDNGLTNREIAIQLAISEKTVEQHLSKALRCIRKKIQAIS